MMHDGHSMPSCTRCGIRHFRACGNPGLRHASQAGSLDARLRGHDGSRFQFTAAALGALAAACALPAVAYVGPGAGLSLIGALWGLVAAVAAALFFILMWPIRRMLRRRRQASEQAAAQDSATQPPPPSR